MGRLKRSTASHTSAVFNHHFDWRDFVQPMGAPLFMSYSMSPHYSCPNFSDLTNGGCHGVSTLTHMRDPTGDTAEIIFFDMLSSPS